MNSVELFFLDLGCSWTFSKLFPYLFSILVGIILVLFYKKFFSSRLKNILRTYFLYRKKIIILSFNFFIQLILIIIPFILYFAYSPIYKGDFSNNLVEILKSETEKELGSDKLFVLSIPGCPHCFNTIDKMMKIKSRIPNIQIEYVVCSKDPETLMPYKDKIPNIKSVGDLIKVTLAKNPQSISRLASGRFPSFVLVQKNKIFKWSNDNFGVCAVDYVESIFN